MNWPVPQKITAKLIKKEKLNTKITQIYLKIISPVAFQFLSGQFVTLKVAETTFRSYSICSSALDSKNINLIVETGHKGVGSNFLNNLKDGSMVEMVGPSGRFVIPQKISTSLVFIATGTGIAPFFSMFDDLKNKKCKYRIKLYFGVRTPDDLFGLNFLEEFKKSLYDFNYTLCFSQQMPQEQKENYFLGRVTSAVDLSNVEDTQYFLCGNPNMVFEMNEILKGRGVSELNIYHEKFTVSKPKV